MEDHWNGAFRDGAYPRQEHISAQTAPEQALLPYRHLAVTWGGPEALGGKESGSWCPQSLGNGDTGRAGTTGDVNHTGRSQGAWRRGSLHRQATGREPAGAGRGKPGEPGNLQARFCELNTGCGCPDIKTSRWLPAHGGPDSPFCPRFQRRLRQVH